MFSNYQSQKQGLLSRYYNKLDVFIQQEKLNNILNQYHNYTTEKKVIANKFIKLYRENIEFICRMINQQILES